MRRFVGRSLFSFLIIIQLERKVQIGIEIEKLFYEAVQMIIITVVKIMVANVWFGLYSHS